MQANILDFMLPPFCFPPDLSFEVGANGGTELSRPEDLFVWAENSHYNQGYWATLNGSNTE
jgi:hypothetical protein